MLRERSRTGICEGPGEGFQGVRGGWQELQEDKNQGQCVRGYSKLHLGIGYRIWHQEVTADPDAMVLRAMLVLAEGQLSILSHLLRVSL